MISHPGPEKWCTMAASVTFVMLMVLMSAVLAAGCVGGDCPSPKYVPVITKVSSDGTHIWTTMIDTGVDNRANDMIVTPDGDIVIAGSEAVKKSSCEKEVKPNIIRLVW